MPTEHCLPCYEELPKNRSLKWSELSYAGEWRTPFGEEPLAHSWRLCFLTREGNLFKTSEGKVLPLDIKEPDMNFGLRKQFLELVNIQKNLTANQIAIAKYWGDGPPSKQFMPIADILIDTYGVSACRAARILYVLNGALNDTCNVTWYLKYKFDVLRPNQYSQHFKTLLCTPRHPSYPAGHSAMAGCMCEILAYYFPAEREKLEFLAEECSISRIYAGVHYSADCDEGVALGKSVARAIIEDLKHDINAEGLVVDRPYTEFKDADIFPKDYKQYIPFDRQSRCSSLLID